MEMNIIKKFQGKTAGEMIRYLLGGGCTTMVNLAALNYLISKFLVFGETKMTGGSVHE